MKRLILLMAVLALCASASALAHHSFAAAYHEDRIQTVEGDITSILFRNPHTWLYIDGKDENGRVQRYSIEWGSGVQLTQQGVARDTLKPGDHVIVTGNPGRNTADRRLRMRVIERPADGWRWGGTFD
jgi:hypothetical protein